VTGAVSLSATAATITHTGTGGATNGLAITSTQGYVDVESVRFTADEIGTTNDPDLVKLADNSVTVRGAIAADTTLSSTGDFAVNTDKFKVTASSGAVSMSSAAQTITHSGATSLTISSSQAAAFVKIEGGASAYVDVESVRFTDNQIGISADTDLITLTNNAVTIAGGLTTTTMAVTSTFGVTSDFTVNTDKFIVYAANGNTEMTGNLLMSGDTATLSHSGSTGGLAISSAQHVDVESVRFTRDQIRQHGRSGPDHSDYRQRQGGRYFGDVSEQCSADALGDLRAWRSPAPTGTSPSLAGLVTTWTWRVSNLTTTRSNPPPRAITSQSLVGQVRRTTSTSSR
jgi:hypothetical protein